MEKQPLVFWINGSLSSAEEFVEDYPLPQTQALLLTLDEISVWTDHTRSMFGDAAVPGLDTYRAWLDEVDDLISEVWGQIEEQEIPEVITCRLDSDDPLIEHIESVVENYPHPDDIRDRQRSKAVGTALVSLTMFWMRQLLCRVNRLQSLLMGDGEVLATLKNQQILGQLSS